jgi:hypothetical protein
VVACAPQTHHEDHDSVMGSNQPQEAGTSDARRRRIHRAEALLDRWLDLYDILLERGHRSLLASDAAPKLPDLTRLTDLANVFTIIRRCYEIELVARRVDDATPTDQGFELDPRLLLGSLSEEDADT